MGIFRKSQKVSAIYFATKGVQKGVPCDPPTPLKLLRYFQATKGADFWYVTLFGPNQMKCFASFYDRLICCILYQYSRGSRDS